jgi:hypothetical protein
VVAVVLMAVAETVEAEWAALKVAAETAVDVEVVVRAAAMAVATVVAAKVVRVGERVAWDIAATRRPSSR